MALSGIDAVVFGVADPDAAQRLLDDWGLVRSSAAPVPLCYATRDGGEVIVHPAQAPDLPPAIEPGSTLRELVWGAPDAASLAESVARLRAGGIACAAGPDGAVRLRDPNGMALALRVSRRRPVAVAATPANGPGAPQRIDRRAPVHARAAPATLGHVVLFAADFAAMRDFYTRHLGFVVSDEYPGHGVFLRCAARGPHHNLFLLNRPGRPGVNHVAFTVADIHEVIGGGIAMSRRGWKTEIGPGRHPISSAYFWYFHNPLGPPLEYYADDDFCTDAWQPGTFERRPELFAEWAIAGGIDGATRRQARATEESGRGHA